MKRLIKDLGAQLGAALLIATTSAAQSNPEAPADAAPIAGSGAAGFGVMAGAGGVGGFAGGMAPFGDVRVVNTGAGIPVGGAILIAAGAGTGSAPIVEVSNVDTPTTTLGGTLTPLAGGVYWAWVPSAPFTAGSTYQVRLSAPDIGVVGVTTTFEAVPAITITRPAIESAPSASWRGETNNWACCRTLSGGTLAEASCFPSEQLASIMLEPGFSTSDPAVLLNQFVFRVGTAELSATASGMSLWPNVVVSPLYTQAEEYCFDLEAIEIVSGAVHTYQDIARCAPHGDLKDLGLIAIEPGAAELDRVVCHAPPEQYTDQWCDLNEDPCADNANETACGLYGFVCEGEPLPPDPFSMMMAGFGGMTGGFGAIGGSGSGAVGGIGGSTSGGAGGASGMSDESDAGDDDDDEDDKKSSGSSSGCSVSSARGASDGGATFGYAISAAALAWLSRRRKRSA